MLRYILASAVLSAGLLAAPIENAAAQGMMAPGAQSQTQTQPQAGKGPMMQSQQGTQRQMMMRRGRRAQPNDNVADQLNACQHRAQGERMGCMNQASGRH